MDAAVFFSTRERLTWERWLELVPPAELKSAEWVVEPGDGVKLSLSLELAPRVSGTRLEIFFDGGRRGTTALKDGQNVVELGALEPGSGDDLARVWFAWKEGAELLALLSLGVARADGAWHALVEDVTGRPVGSPARSCVTKEGNALVLEVSVAEAWPEGILVEARPDVPAEERPPLWKDDGVEWFLADSERRVHFLANRAGMFDVESDEATKGLLEGRAKLDSREDAWRMQLPDIFEPGVLRMNVVRNRVVEGATECHAWSPTRGDSHEKEYWGHLVR